MTQNETKTYVDMSEDVSDGDPGSIPYPSSPSQESIAEDAHNDMWDCGTDWVIIKDPQTGNIHTVEFYLPCDPTADTYKGCPPPDSTKQEQQK